MACNKVEWYEIVAMFGLFFLVLDIGKWLYAAFAITINPALWTIVSLDRWVPALWIIESPIILLGELVLLVVCFIVVFVVFVKRIVRS